jgi:catalase-peroxidase
MSNEDTGPVTTTDEEDAPAARCPVLGHSHTATGSMANQHWWPEQLNLRPLAKNSPQIDPMGDDFDYATEFESLDLAAVKADIADLLTTSQDWWPADYGHYGPLFIRMAWHSAGTYRIHDGRGGAGSGTQRFAPLNSWPDNANLDKARRLLWPVKQKYGRKLSWADLMILAGNVALESMGFATFGFGGGREDVWEPEEDIYWGPEDTWLADERYSGDRELANPLGAVQMGLIYVNPEGPNGEPDPGAAARDIRETFARMAMDDEETVALIAGGHTFGKTHGAADADEHVGREPEGASLEEQGLGWTSTFGSGNGATPSRVGWRARGPHAPARGTTGTSRTCSATTGTWCAARPVPSSGYPPIRRRPAPCPTPTTRQAARPDHAHHRPGAADGPDLRRDLARLPRAPRPVRRRLRPGLVQAHPPRHGSDLAVPRSARCRRAADLAGPGARRRPRPGRRADIAALKATILGVGPVGLPAGVHGVGVGLHLPRTATSAAAPTAPASASRRRRTGRPTTRRPGHGARRPGADPGRLQRLPDRRKAVSLADLIVLGGCAAVEQAARSAGHDVTVPFSPGRTDATQEQTDVEAFAVLEPTADGFRNYSRAGDKRRPEDLLVDRASQLTLTAPEMTVLVGGLRVLGANAGRRRPRRVHRPARHACPTTSS